jgi:hypothetical protein
MSRSPKRRGAPRAAARPRREPGRAGSVPRAWSLAVALVALAVYVAQCPPVSGDKDSAEFTLVLALNGVAHPTGYPLFTLLGHVFVRLAHALGATWAYAANCWAALGGGVAIYFLHRLAAALPPPSTRLSRRARFLLALLPVGLFAFNPIWTYETTLAEVYSWHVAWALGAALCFAMLVRALCAEPTPAGPGLYRRAALWGLLCGVGGAHHATSIFVAAPLSVSLLFVLAARRRLRVGLVAAALAAACVPLLSYGLIPWRAAHPAVYQWPRLAPGFAGLLAHVTGSMYQGLLGRFAPSPEQSAFLRSYVYPFLFPGLVLLLANAVRARTPGERALQWGIVGSALLGTVYAFDYGVPDPSSYFLLPMALGLTAITPWLGSLLAGGTAARRAGLAGVTLAALAGLVLAVPWLRTGQGRKGLWIEFDQLVRRMWATVPADSAIVFWTDDMHTKLLEYQLLRGEKPGVTVVHGLTLDAAPVREAFIRRHGFDPLAGVEVPSGAGTGPAAEDARVRELIQRIERRVNEQTPLPVIHFDPNPQRPKVRLLLKPGADSSAVAGRP